ncbi:hypothetical protein ACOME3_001337 [Neoechinorhynchus agilis]
MSKSLTEIRSECGSSQASSVSAQEKELITVDSCVNSEIHRNLMRPQHLGFDFSKVIGESDSVSSSNSEIKVDHGMSADIVQKITETVLKVNAEALSSNMTESMAKTTKEETNKDNLYFKIIVAGTFLLAFMMGMHFFVIIEHFAAHRKLNS